MMGEELSLEPWAPLEDRRKDSDDAPSPWVSLLGKAAITIIMHPFDLASTLVQIGHEPMPPVHSYSIFGRPRLQLPGVFSYLGHIRRVDGFTGLFRGAMPGIAGRLFHDACFVAVTERLPPIPTLEEVHSRETDSEKIVNLIERTCYHSLAFVVATTAAQPFRVVTVRMIAQFIGRETKYTSVLGSLLDIHQEEGLCGLWSGLVPRLIGDVLRITIAEALAYLINFYLINDAPIRSYILSLTNLVGSSLMYPYAVVSTVMSVSGAPLAAGGPPQVALYSNWTQCYAHLKKHGQLKRGASMLWRYKHPVRITNNRAYPKYVDFGSID